MENVDHREHEEDKDHGAQGQRQPAQLPRPDQREMPRNVELGNGMAGVALQRHLHRVGGAAHGIGAGHALLAAEPLIKLDGGLLATGSPQQSYQDGGGQSQAQEGQGGPPHIAASEWSPHAEAERLAGLIAEFDTRGADQGHVDDPVHYDEEAAGNEHPEQGSTC